jgi:hypothetical protein
MGWYSQLQDSLADIAIPHAAVRLSARPSVRAAADAVLEELVNLSTAVGSAPRFVDQLPTGSAKHQGWRGRVDKARAAVQGARSTFAEAVSEK